MKKVVQSEKYGEITYNENFWIGRKSVDVNGAPLKKLDKKTFETADGERVTVKGNYLYGVKLLIGADTIDIMPTVKWYEIVLALLPFIFVMVWGNSVALCRVVPVVGGAIGGLISGLMAAVSLLAMRSIKSVWGKIGIAAVALGVTFGICAGIGHAILAAL